MSEKTILVIDDSATIRKLVDTHLSPAGYRVVLTANAEDGLQTAEEIEPDLILLDHQLPGTTGFEVAGQLASMESLKHIPVVVSSTLRKKAYAEYTDLDNVVDMLPKPYTDELLRTTVANALETASMVVSSQSHGTAIPEVIEQLGEADISGSFALFGLREVLDFLNNGGKTGVLEVEAERARLAFHLDRGRIQGVSASGIDEREMLAMTDRLPESLANLAPVMKMTVRGRSCAEVDGFVQLLDRKVLDPRLMTKLLRFQAAMLVRLVFARKLIAFRFQSGQPAGLLHRNLPLDISLLALLVEGAIHGESSGSYDAMLDKQYRRRAIRGQNLDRAGLSARHMKILGLLSELRSVDELASQLGWEKDEVCRVLHGFVMAELVEEQQRAAGGNVVIFETDPAAVQQLRRECSESSNRYQAKVVRDRLGLQLLLKRSVVDTLVFPGDDSETCRFIHDLFASGGSHLASVQRVAVVADSGQPDTQRRCEERLGFLPDQVLSQPYTVELVFRSLGRRDGKMAAEENQAEPSVPLSAMNSPETTAVGAL